MALEYISIDNTAPKTRLWQQYKKNDVVRSFFDYLKTYWQNKYFTYLDTTIIPNLSIYNANNSYLSFFALNIFGIKNPIKLSGQIYWDSDNSWDSGLEWDFITSAGYLTYSEFRTVLMFILDWSRPNWDVPTLFYLISKFTGLDWDDITIVQDNTNLDLFTITVPTTTATILLQQMINYYQVVLGLPFGVSFVIVLA